LISGLLFELPLVIVFLANTGLVRIEEITAKRKHVVIAIFITAAVVTPGPDVFMQFLVAIPLYLLFEGGVLSVRVLQLFKHKGVV
jgi:sec-independent protein translocase protein TatC